MRIHLLGLILMAGAAMPAVAQERIDRRLDRLEQEMQAVQRVVFPGGAGQGTIIQPEIQPRTGVDVGGLPASSALSDLTARVDAMEAQLERLTGQVEENAYRLRQMEEQLTKYRGDVDFRLNALEQARTPAPAAEEPPAELEEDEAAGGPDEAAAIERPDTGDPAEDAYLYGYRLWEAGRYADAQKALEAMAEKYPDHRRASYARNLAGRAALDDGKPATAAKILLANYQDDPQGERAADSLYFLGEALMELKKPEDACKVYAELQDVYGGSMRGFISQRLPEAMEAANCG